MQIVSVNYFRVEKGFHCDIHWASEAKVKMRVVRNNVRTETFLCAKCFSKRQQIYQKRKKNE